MIVWQLQQQFPSKIPSNFTDTFNLGSCLLNFFYTYGFEFDYVSRTTIQPTNPMQSLDVMATINLNINSMSANFYQMKFVIQDPLNALNNVARSTFKIQGIKVF